MLEDMMTNSLSNVVKISELGAATLLKMRIKKHQISQGVACF